MEDLPRTEQTKRDNPQVKLNLKHTLKRMTFFQLTHPAITEQYLHLFESYF